MCCYFAITNLTYLKTIIDSELLASLRSGNRMNVCARSLYRDHFVSLSTYVLHNHGNKQDAEDVFQDVVINFINVLQKDKFREESGIRTFLYSLNRHIWLNELKKRGRAQAKEKKYMEQQDMPEIDINALIERKQNRLHVRELLDRLDEPCKKLLLLYYYENLSTKEMLSHFEFENEQSIRNKKCKCEKQLARIIKKAPILKRSLKNLLQEEKEALLTYSQ